MPSPRAASLARAAWRPADARSRATCSSLLAFDATLCTKAAASAEADRIVSVRPLMKWAVEADSYVLTGPLPSDAQWKASCRHACTCVNDDTPEWTMTASFYSAKCGEGVRAQKAPQKRVRLRAPCIRLQRGVQRVQHTVPSGDRPHSLMRATPNSSKWRQDIESDSHRRS